jgi:hypothetical protein
VLVHRPGAANAVHGEALTCPENERVGHQPQLVDQVVLHQRLHERAPSRGIQRFLELGLGPLLAVLV